jgi:4-hydroxy-3-polyprenylbenzoate decarboxylase
MTRDLKLPVRDVHLLEAGGGAAFLAISLRRAHPALPQRAMWAAWAYEPSFSKFIVVVDEDIDARDWKEVVWAITTRVDPARDTLIVENTPIDYLDFASPATGLGSKMGIDATDKWPGETSRRWGRRIAMDEAVERRVDAVFRGLGL